MRRGRRDAERGAVLLVVMIVMLLLLGLGVTSLWLTSGNLQVAGNMGMRTQAFYCAEAGLERARAFLNTAPPTATSAFLTSLLPGSNPAVDNVPSSLDPATGLPVGVGALLVDVFGPMQNVAFPPPSFQRGVAPAGGVPMSTTMGTYTVWIRNDTADCRRGSFTADTNNTVVIRSQCVATDGRTNVVLEATFTPPSSIGAAPIYMDCLDTGKGLDDANTNTKHCERGR